MDDECFLPTYTVPRYNISGLWSSYDDWIVQSCAVFLYPFSFTYKHPSCYLCNMPTDDLTHTIGDCSDATTGGNPDNPKSPFQALVGLHTVTQQINCGNKLNCDKTSFKDEIKVLQISTFPAIYCRFYFLILVYRIIKYILF